MCGAGYGDRTRLTGLGSQSITTMLSPQDKSGFTTSAKAPVVKKPNATYRWKSYHARIRPSTSSRFSAINTSVFASRFNRKSGSVFDGRTLKCHSGYSTEMPSSVY